MRPNRITLVCVQCGTEFARKASQAKNAKYCGKPCQYAAAGTAEDRFWAHVEKSPDPDGCWLWTGRTDNGYGTLGVSRPGYRSRSMGAHVFSWVLHHGLISKGTCVCHSCDVRHPPGSIEYRRCVRPDHLFLGTKSENTRDMWQKARGPTGDRSGATKHPERYPRGDDHHMRRLVSSTL